MFGINDNDHNDNAQQGAPEPAMPPSPFLDDNPKSDAQPDAPVEDNQPQQQPKDQPADSPSADDSLVSIKEQALSNLAPLVGHLDQTPEEKFKTTMMLIQASDNSSLIKEAYEAANQIKDEKTRAQALLDVVNEINYFTQKEK